MTFRRYWLNKITRNSVLQKINKNLVCFSVRLLTLTHTSHFTILESACVCVLRGGGARPPELICPIAIELPNKDERKVWDVLNLIIKSHFELSRALAAAAHQLKWTKGSPAL